MQEMAHTCLATNLLVAIGGTPLFDGSAGVPTYPSEMPLHVPPLTLRLQAASVPVVRDVFCAIERPMTVRDVSESGDWTTIGQFYAAIMAVLFIVFFRGSDDIFAIIGGLLVSGPLYLGLGYVLAKFGYSRQKLGELGTRRAAPAGQPAGDAVERARPAPTRRTSGGSNRPTRGKRR